jgi:predicted alpha/beta superfamily hydrolase
MHFLKLGKFFGICCFALLFADAMAKDKNVPWDKLYGLGPVEYIHMQTQKNGDENQSYHIFVRLPEDLDPSGNTKYPTLYLLDGGTNFPLFASYYKYLRFMQDVPSMIIVGISYGTQDWRKGNARSVDFTAPSKEKELWGGAQKFEQYIAEDLMPMLQKSYPVDSSKQVLFGQSLGGQFGLYTSMYGKAPFYAVIATNPALHRNLEYFKRPLPPRKDRPKTYIISAQNDAEIFREPALQWQQHWQNKSLDWQRVFINLPSHNHLSANPEAFRNGLKWVFANQPSS